MEEAFTEPRLLARLYVLLGRRVVYKDENQCEKVEI